MITRFILFLVASLCLFFSTSKASIIYIDSAHIGGTQSGSSWATAFADFKQGVNASNAGDSIWVAKGTYKPAYLESFSMKEGVKILGGFLNTDTAYTQRNWQSNATILEGNYNYSVIVNFINQLTPAALLDGFTITHGQSNFEGGGGMENRDVSPTIKNCIFKYNVGYLGSGGGIYNDNSFPIINNCSFLNNTGSGIYNTWSYSMLLAADSITGCTFADNSDNGIFSDASDTFFISSCNFSHNNSGINSNAPVSVFHLTDCNFSNQIYGSGVQVPLGVGIADFNNCSFTGNGAYSGGGVDIYGLRTSFINCTFQNNSASDGGGAVRLWAADSSTFTSCTFTDNSSNYAGGVYVWSGSLAFHQCSFTGNSGLSGGLGINSYVTYFSVDSCTFDSNDGANGGGAIYTAADSSVITNCTFSNNISLAGGGILNDYTSTSKISHCTFLNNGTIETNGFGGVGGGILNKNIATRIDSCVFIGNSAIYGGGGIYNILDTLTTGVRIENSLFQGNISYDPDHGGGGIYNGGGCTIDKCRFIYDTASYGGGIYNRYALAMITNSLFEKNYARTAGGAISNDNATERIVNCTIAQNKSVLGSSLYHVNATSAASNSIIWGNYSSYSNFSIYNDSSSVFDINYSLSQDYPANANLHLLDSTTNPLFVDTSGIGNYQLQTISACVNSGDVDSIPFGIYKDLQGNPRIMGTNVDLGAYEYLLPPISTIGNDTAICSGDSILLNAGNLGAVYLWNTGATSQTIEIDGAGTFIVTITNPAGSVSDTINVVVNQKPIVDLGNDTLVGSGSAINLDAGNPGASYLWNTGNTAQVQVASTTGTYSVTVTNSSGCHASDSINVTFDITSIADINNEVKGWEVNPNPTKGVIYVNLKDPHLFNTVAYIMDTYGRVVKSITINKKTQQISLSDFANGMYFIQLVNGQSVKLLKE